MLFFSLHFTFSFIFILIKLSHQASVPLAHHLFSKHDRMSLLSDMAAGWVIFLSLCLCSGVACPAWKAFKLNGCMQPSLLQQMNGDGVSLLGF